MKSGQARLAERADERTAPLGSGAVKLGRAELGRVRIARQPGRYDVEAANGIALEADGDEAERVARRWQGFLTLAIARGVSIEEIEAGFTKEDIDDLCAPEHDDETLVRCLDTLATASRRDEQTRIGMSADADGSAAVPETVRCADCRHFRRRATHPHLGDCEGEGTRTAAGGFWNDQERGCEAFAPLSRRLVRGS